MSLNLAIVPLAHATPEIIADKIEGVRGLIPITDNFIYQGDLFQNQSAKEFYSVAARLSDHRDLVLRFEVRNGDRAIFDHDDRDRAEAMSQEVFGKDQVVWNAYRVKIAKNFSISENKNAYFIIGQWHGSKEDGRSPYIAIQMNGNKLSVIRRFIVNGEVRKDIMYEIDGIDRDVWTNIAIEHRVSDNNGILNVWIAGHQVVRFSGPVGYTDHYAGGYWKFGIYRNRQMTDASVEYRDVVVGTDEMIERALLSD
ncbi:hypothetical protein ASG42_28135 [Rhizobium sp. Leaf391]|nr:hypothetical protein ASG42_28135 [Rhizobium sp. Leaf391]